MLRHLTRFVTLIGIISFSLSCGHELPKTPSIDSGVIIAEINEVFYVNNQTGDENYKPVIINGVVNPELHKSVVHSNHDWNQILLYIRLLENRIKSKTVKKELRKIRKSYVKLDEEVKAYGL